LWNLSEDASVVELASGMNVMNFNVAVSREVKGEKRRLGIELLSLEMIFRYLFLKRTKVFLWKMILSNTPTMREKQANQKIIVFEIELLVQHKNNGNSSTNRTSSNRNSASTTGK
jgi:hypothetical protein